jgi:Fe-S cluster biogenesis protein NfuA
MAIEEEIQLFLRESIEPYIASHNGHIRFITFEDGIVFIELSGSCSMCSASTITMSLHIERQIRKKFREVKKVQLAT